jgi:hypothetical protein
MHEQSCGWVQLCMECMPQPATTPLPISRSTGGSWRFHQQWHMEQLTTLLNDGHVLPFGTDSNS